MPAFLVHVLFVLPLLLVAAKSQNNNACTASSYDCSFYQCVESLYHCGSEGYPIGYGYKYCHDFQTSKDDFTEAGQAWVSNVTYCLENALVPYLTQEEVQSLSCDELKDTAFGTHAKCYVEAGVCTLPPQDWAEIVHIIGPETLIMNYTLIQALETAELCVENGAVDFFEAHCRLGTK